MKKTKRRLIKKQNIQQLIILLIIIVLINVVGSYVFTRFDLTTEKRYTLSDNTKKIITELDDIVYFKVYLEGNLPASYKRLRNETQIMLNEFRSYNKSNIQFEFVNLAEDKDRKALFQIYEELSKKGIQPIVDYDGSDAEMSQRVIVPGAIASYKEREAAVYLLVSTIGPGSQDKEVIVNNSIQEIEFKLADAMRKLTTTIKPRVAVLEGYGQLKPVQTVELERELREYYRVERIRINQQLKALDGFQSLIVAKPDSAFDEKDKFIIDQFIMRGGKVLWCIDAVAVDMDSLRTKNETIALAKNLNLEDMLFKYGARIGTNLIMDINGASIPMVTGMIGDQPQYQFFSWNFFPVIFPNQPHPVVKNLNAIRTEFVSSIDTVGGRGIKKTALLTTSRYTRLLNTPLVVSLNALRETPDKKLYNRANIPVAVLLEGEFESLYLHRIPEIIAENPDINFKEKSPENRMLVISDGDIIKNQHVWRDGNYMTYPLGFDRFTNTTYGNKDFILNAMNYLCDDDNLLDIRSRELKIRLLDKTRISKEKFKWQMFNIFIPLLPVILIGIILMIIRHRIFV